MKTRLLMMSFISLFGLSACTSEGKDTDTGSTEDTDTDTDTEETDTEETGDTDTDTEETGDTDTEDTGDEVETQFPDLLTQFEEMREGSDPAPLIEADWLGNTTSLMMTGLSFAPVIELQEYVAEQTEPVTCPDIQGTFPEDGIPTEDIIVTGNGCTTPEGQIYDGSFVYNAEGVTYTDYSVQTFDELCTEVYETQMMNGAIYLENNITDIFSESLVFIDAENVDEEAGDCSVTPMEFALHAFNNIDFGVNNTQVVNGTGSAIIMTHGFKFDLDVVTADELIDRAVCESEPISGTNTMTNGVDELVYTFDGETDCDESPTQMLSINGAAAEEVAGTSCSTIESRGILGLFGGLLGLLWVRRRK